MSDSTTAAARGRELTLRAITLGGVLTLMFAAANVYLGPKVGLTFATSIPAAVISMALLRYMAGSTILENNIVQTIASAAGTLAAIIFVLPPLAIGIGIYLPMAVIRPVVIVGESLFGVLYAGIVAGSGSDAPLAVVGDGYAPFAPWVGLILFVGLVWLSYRRTRQVVVATP